ATSKAGPASSTASKSTSKPSHCRARSAAQQWAAASSSLGARSGIVAADVRRRTLQQTADAPPHVGGYARSHDARQNRVRKRQNLQSKSTCCMLAVVMGNLRCSWRCCALAASSVVISSAPKALWPGRLASKDFGFMKTQTIPSNDQAQPQAEYLPGTPAQR